MERTSSCKRCILLHMRRVNAYFIVKLCAYFCIIQPHFINLKAKSARLLLFRALSVCANYIHTELESMAATRRGL
jgi:hypothetical protein